MLYEAVISSTGDVYLFSLVLVSSSKRGVKDKVKFFLLSRVLEHPEEEKAGYKISEIREVKGGIWMSKC